MHLSASQFLVLTICGSMTSIAMPQTRPGYQALLFDPPCAGSTQSLSDAGTSISTYALHSSTSADNMERHSRDKAIVCEACNRCRSFFDCKSSSTGWYVQQLCGSTCPNDVLSKHTCDVSRNCIDCELISRSQHRTQDDSYDLDVEIPPGWQLSIALVPAV